MQLKKKVKKALQILSMNPSHPSLHSHKADSRKHGKRWSSNVTGDIRIIWDFGPKNTLIILLLDIGSHTGKHKVYK